MASRDQCKPYRDYSLLSPNLIVKRRLSSRAGTGGVPAVAWLLGGGPRDSRPGMLIERHLSTPALIEYYVPLKAIPADESTQGWIIVASVADVEPELSQHWIHLSSSRLPLTTMMTYFALRKKAKGYFQCEIIIN